MQDLNRIGSLEGAFEALKWYIRKLHTEKSNDFSKIIMLVEKFQK